LFGNINYLSDHLQMKPSVQLLLVTRFKKQNGKYPVKIRIIYQRVSKDFPIGIDLTQEEFDGASSTHVKKRFREFANKMNEAIAKANRIINDTGVFTFNKFDTLFNGRFKEASDIYPFFDEYIDNLYKEGRIKTASSYETARNSFAKFNNKIGLYDITCQFLRDYHAYQVERNISETTVGIYVRSLRSIYNYAIELGVIKRDESYPFGKRKYVIPAGRNIKKALNISEVGKIYNYPSVPGTPEDRARDFWIFSYLCNGINFKDIAHLKNKNIDGDMIRFVRAKTKNTTKGNQTVISCHISEPAKLIIEKWRGKNESDDAYLFTILQSGDDPIVQVKKVAQFIKNTNKYMKAISEQIGLEKPATSYFSRHSAATILKRSGASIEEIREALGHQSSNTTQKYLDSFDDESKKQLSDSLSTFLK